MKCRRKPKGVTARLRASKSRKRKAEEAFTMLAVRLRDDYCRFPLCGCTFRPSGPMVDRPPFVGHETTAEVSHQKHRGMGGNPAGDRTVTGLLLLVCNWRHKLSKFSIDKKTIKWEALTDAGADGPIRWLIDLDAWQTIRPNPAGVVVVNFDEKTCFYVLAVETAPHEYEPFSESQAAILGYLASMSQ